MSTTNNDDLLHGTRNPLDLKQQPLPNNALPNAGFWNAPKPEGSKPIEEPKGAWPYVTEQPPVLAQQREGFTPEAERPSGGLVLPESAPLHPDEVKAIHLNRMIQGAPLAHQRANREAAKQRRGDG